MSAPTVTDAQARTALADRLAELQGRDFRASAAGFITNRTQMLFEMCGLEEVAAGTRRELEKLALRTLLQPEDTELYANEWASALGPAKVALYTSAEPTDAHE